MNPKQKKGPAQPLISKLIPNTYRDTYRNFQQKSPAITAMILFVLMTAWSLGSLGNLPVYAEENVQVDPTYGLVRIPSNLPGASLLVNSAKLVTDDLQGYSLQVGETNVQFEKFQVAKAFAVSLTKRGEEVEAAKLIQSGCYFQISLPTGIADLTQEDYALYHEVDGIWKKVSSWEILDRTQGSILVNTGSLARWALIRLKKVAQIHPESSTKQLDPSHNTSAQIPCYVPIPLAVAGREGPQLVEPNKKPGEGSTQALPETGERSYTPYVLINALLAGSFIILQASYRKSR